MYGFVAFVATKAPHHDMPVFRTASHACVPKRQHSGVQARTITWASRDSHHKIKLKDLKFATYVLIEP